MLSVPKPFANIELSLPPGILNSSNDRARYRYRNWQDQFHPYTPPVKYIIFSLLQMEDKYRLNFILWNDDDDG